MVRITINDIYFDPEAQLRALSRAGFDSSDSSESNYVIIQSSAPLAAEQKRELNELGVEILEYYPENAYVCRFLPNSLTAIQTLSYIEFAGVYPQDVKVALPLRSTTAAATANLLNLEPIETSMAQDPVMVDIVLHGDVASDAVRDAIAQAVRLDPEDIDIRGNKVRLLVLPQQLEDLAAIDQVKLIQEVRGYKLFNNVALEILQVGPVHNPTNLRGEGQIVAVCDTGFDKGDLTDLHPAFKQRLLKLYALGRSRANDPDGHGTHVAGSVLGDGTSASMGGAIQGTAPAAQLVFQSVLDSQGGLGGLPENLNDLFLPPYQQDQARVHTNSWGAPTFGRYTQDSREVDEFVYRHRDCVICFAAGNDGKDANANGVIDAGSVGSPGTAKNCITVGASESNRPGSKRYGDAWRQDYPIAPIATDPWANNPEGMAAFSSRGPTRQNRIKPDVVAPGTSILSTCSRDAQIGSFWGQSDDPLFCFLGGTSMATPLVAGCAAVVRQFLQRDRAIANPSAALVKAMLINGAVEMTGQYIPSEAGAIPNSSQGFGRVNLAATVGLSPDAVPDIVPDAVPDIVPDIVPDAASSTVTLELRDEDRALDTGEAETISLDGSAGNLLKVTLVWSDAPGEALQNDLDLVVRVGGEERHGNLPAGSTAFDRSNNVEQVIWPGIAAGPIEITVRAHRAIQPQTYALVIRSVRSA